MGKIYAPDTIFEFCTWAENAVEKRDEDMNTPDTAINNYTDA